MSKFLCLRISILLDKSEFFAIFHKFVEEKNVGGSDPLLWIHA
jgi:hypothetical protein